MDGAREYYAKKNKSVRERQMPYYFIHMWNLRNKTNKEKKREKPKKWTLNRSVLSTLQSCGLYACGPLMEFSS